jgi:hypothetical protein
MVSSPQYAIFIWSIGGKWTDLPSIIFQGKQFPTTPEQTLWIF